MNRIFIILIAATQSFWVAAGHVTLLDVKGNNVLFKLDNAKAATPPNCVTAENSQLWSLSLSNQSGKAMYALLMTAMSTQAKVSIVSANDCAVIEGYERAERISVESQIQDDAPYSEIKATSKRIRGNLSSSVESSMDRYKEFINSNDCPLAQGWRACFDEDIDYALKQGHLTSPKLSAHHNFPAWYHSSKMAPNESLSGVSSNCRGFSDYSSFGQRQLLPSSNDISTS